jgi:ABC-2 type transport system permease protein
VTTYSALSRAAFKASTRDVTTVFFTFAFPLIFLIVFGTIFHDQPAENTANNQINYVTSGVLAWGVANAALFTVMFTLMQWRNDDLLRLIRMTPTSLASVLASRYVMGLLTALVQSVLFVAVALLPFFGLKLHDTWPLAVPVVLLGVTAFLALGLALGSRTNTPEAVAAVANSIIVPMAFISGAFLPLSLLPEWLQGVAKLLPMYYINHGLDIALSGEGNLAEYGQVCAALLGFTVVFGAIGIKTFRWTNRP